MRQAVAASSNVIEYNLPCVSLLGIIWFPFSIRLFEIWSNSDMSKLLSLCSCQYCEVHPAERIAGGIAERPANQDRRRECDACNKTLASNHCPLLFQATSIPFAASVIYQRDCMPGSVLRGRFERPVRE